MTKTRKEGKQAKIPNYTTKYILNRKRNNHIKNIYLTEQGFPNYYLEFSDEAESFGTQPHSTCCSGMHPKTLAL